MIFIVIVFLMSWIVSRHLIHNTMKENNISYPFMDEMALFKNELKQDKNYSKVLIIYRVSFFAFLISLGVFLLQL
jgi:hypothetical protein